jgi:hypothetical protein
MYVAKIVGDFEDRSENGLERFSSLILVESTFACAESTIVPEGSFLLRKLGDLAAENVPDYY